MKKHAYLIMAHNNFEQLNKLLQLLDYEENDIYVHIDKKSKLDKEYLLKHIKKSNVIFTDRVKVTWGSFSQIQAELVLLKESVKNNYEYYHLISGFDMPLKKQQDIHEFFNKNTGKIFVHFRKDDDYEGIDERIKYYYIATDFRKKKGLEKVIKYAFFKSFLLLQKLFRVNRLKNNMDIIKSGANWFSIPNDLAKYIVENEERIVKKYKRTFCGDEVFLQTLVYNNNEFKDRLYYKGFDDNYISILRKIEWKDKKPYVWQEKDFEYLINLDNFFFARKFNENSDNKIIDKIYEYLK